MVTSPTGDTLSFVLIGEQSLLIQCGDRLRTRGHEVRLVVSRNPRIEEWCRQHGLECRPDYAGLEQSPIASFNVLLSVTNLRMLPSWLLARPTRIAVNFHDGPLPRYAGLNAPVWALLNGETVYGVTWHEMTSEADTGAILVQRPVTITAEDTAFSLNAQCYQAGLEGFDELLEGLENGRLVPRPQDLSRRTYFPARQRPAAAALLDWRQPARVLQRLVRALDHGPYPNPMLLPRLDLGGGLLLVRKAKVVPGHTGLLPGAVQALADDSLTIRCGEEALRVEALSTLSGEPAEPATVMAQLGLGAGHRLPVLDAEHATVLSTVVARVCGHEGPWRTRLRALTPTDVPFAAHDPAGSVDRREIAWPGAGGTDGAARVIAALAIALARLSGRPDISLAYRTRAWEDLPAVAARHVEGLVPLTVSIDDREPASAVLARVREALDTLEQRVGFLADLPAREPELRGRLACGDLPVRVVRASSADLPSAAGAGAVITFVVPDVGDQLAVIVDGKRLSTVGADRLLATLRMLAPRVAAAESAAVGDLEILTPDEQRRLASWQSAEQFAAGPAEAAPVHVQFERRAARAPDREACRDGQSALTYGALNARANRLARMLGDRGVTPGDRVGLMLPRTPDLVVAMLAVLKAGAAYVPLDPDYPASRLAFMAADAGLRTLVTHSTLADRLTISDPVLVDRLDLAASRVPMDDLGIPVSPTDLAYLIYTSGSTGTPKGVMVEHRNVANFFLGMDRRLGTEPGVWLAVTSISFDISVLELLWTLTRGFTVVLYTDVRRATPVPGKGHRRPLAFGFFYWNVADGDRDHDADKYRLLIEGARFADTHGFNAVWTPERHFASFGGLFPNPSVTSAALAMVTSRVALRAGSCVVPLHSPIRIAEEWAVVDNLSNGRVGISIASGWAPPDFAIRPEAYQHAKRVMFESTEVVKRLWRGETVPFSGPTGEVAVRTLPRPIQKELPVWVTTAGNVETFREAGASGANLLTHLLGQTVEEVADKVRTYRQAWRDAGHPGHGVVTLMLHTFVGPDAETVEGVVRQPLKAYLESATALVKSAAWQFPTFKKLSEEQGHTLDQFFDTISSEDFDALLEFAFQRYFSTSGLFGTVEHCLAMVDRVRGADIDEIACLIDFGIRTEVVLEHLPYLDALRQRAQEVPDAVPARSVPELLSEYQVTHFQCTPSMAALLVDDAEARNGLAGLRHVLVGGETVPVPLARTLRQLLRGRFTNVYGPTETTVWSSAGEIDVRPGDSDSSVSIGTPLLNQSIYVLDAHQRPLPPGVPGELVIGGAGVARGYWRQPELTAERFVPDPFATGDDARMYRTGDLGRFLPDGRLECLGRLDQQVKIRGHRVELGEIEARLRAHESVREAAVSLREDTRGDQRLVAYVRAADTAMDAAALKEWLRDQLPEFMVPATFVPVGSLPRTPNGKVDRKALPAPPQQRVETAGYRAPVGEMEAMIAEIWKRALGLDYCGTRDNFFDIGGHSLLVVQVLQELRGRVTRPIQMTDLFKYTTIEALARFLSESPGAAAAPAVGAGAARAQARRAAQIRRAQN